MSDSTSIATEQVAAAATPEPATPSTKPKASAKTKARSTKTAAVSEVTAPANESPAGTDATIPAAVVPTAKSKTAKHDNPAKEKKAFAKKPKLVRDSFTFPEDDYALLGALKQRLLTAGREVKKSELLRAGLAVLSAMPTESLLQALDGIDKLKPGRPGK